MTLLYVGVQDVGSFHLTIIKGAGANGDLPVVVRASLLEHQSRRCSGLRMAMNDETRNRDRVRRTTFVDEQTWATFSEFKAGITGRKGESAVNRELATLGHPALHDVILADLFGLTQVDHLVRTPDAILVIETKTYGGYITGTLDSSEWVQHLAGGEVRHAFQNPARQNHRHCRAVAAATAGHDVPIAGAIVSAGSATFCADLEGAVIPIGRLGELFRLSSPRAHDAAALERAWRQLVAAVAATESRREEHHEAMRGRRNGLQRISNNTYSPIRSRLGEEGDDDAAV